jgi:hypothetical protein
MVTETAINRLLLMTALGRRIKMSGEVKEAIQAVLEQDMPERTRNAFKDAIRWSHGWFISHRYDNCAQYVSLLAERLGGVAYYTPYRCKDGGITLKQDRFP